MLELLVAPNVRNLIPAVLLQALYDFAAGHLRNDTTLYTPAKKEYRVLRHADIRTTMNIYTHAVPAALREANSKVVRLVLPAQVA